MSFLKKKSVLEEIKHKQNMQDQGKKQRIWKKGGTCQLSIIW